MRKKISKSNPSQDDFIIMIEALRHELTTKFSDISSSQEMNVETAKLLKEITTIIKELDKLIKDDRDETSAEINDDRNTFYELIKQKSLLETN
ncbi:MAG: hypothetical protein RR388_03600 [Rikenellaceae bacterium]